MQPISLLTAVPLVVFATAAPTLVPHETGRAPSFGVYDPEPNCRQEKNFTFEHLFVSWATYQPGELLRKLQAIQSNGQRPFVTIEPWPDQSISSLPSSLLGDVAAGKYDQRIQQLALEIAAFRAPVLLSWGHEMENVTGRYPWASKNAALYRDAYRHFVTTSRLSAKNISYVWSPVGDKGLERYWPGEQYVDYVGLSVFEFPAFDQAYYHQATRSFHDQMREKYARVSKYRKPIVIAECGVTGSNEYQASWLSDALRDLGNYPLVQALLYFNAKDTPGAWGKELPTPDWRMNGCGLADVIGARS
jgi:cellulose synthase (UDP-forming)